MSYIKKMLNYFKRILKELNPINRWIKVLGLGITSYLSVMIEPGIEFFSKFILLFLVVFIAFPLGYYILGTAVGWVKFINAKAFSMLGTVYVLYYFFVTEFSWNFFEHTNVILCISILLIYGGVCLYEKFESTRIRIVLWGLFIMLIVYDVNIFDKGNIGKADNIETKVKAIYDRIDIEGVTFFQDMNIKDVNREELKYLTYGDSQSAGFINHAAHIETPKVKIGRFIDEPTGVDKTWRMVFWDTDFQEMSMNGRVIFHKEGRNMPLIMIVHGNHSMEVKSEQGYEYLAEFLAEKGYVVALVDQNFLNGSWSGGYDDENDGRAYLLLENIKEILTWNRDKENPLYGRIDKNQIGIVGHSRGGETAFLSKLFIQIGEEPEEYGVDFDFDFDIKSLVLLGSTYGQFESCGTYPKITDVNLLALQGSNDGDVSDFQGKRAYDNTLFSGEGDFFKSYLFIEGANHGQFNTVWGDSDEDFPESMLINKKQLISGDRQREIAKAYIGGFFDCTLKSETKYRKIFKDYINAFDGSDSKRYANGYNDSSSYTLINFDNLNGKKVLRGDYREREKLIKRKNIKLRDDSGLNNYGLHINNSENMLGSLEYEFTRLPESMEGYNYIAFDISGIAEEESIDFALEVEIQASDGEKQRFYVNRDRPLWRNFECKIMNFKELNEEIGDPSEVVFQTIFLPIDIMNIDELKGITFYFDDGEYILDNIVLMK